MNSVEDYVRCVLKVLIYIERHLDEELTLEGIAKIACYSPYHFHRIFQGIVGESIHHYVKRLRLERAAERLGMTDHAVTEIALDSKFETPSSFTKAFKEAIGSSPKRFRADHQRMKMMMKKMNELQMITPDKIEKISDLPLLFVRRYGDYNVSTAEAWKAMFQFIDENKIPHDKLRYFGLFHDNPEITSEEKLRCDAAILAPEGVKEKGEVTRQTLKGGNYAIFTHLGSHDLLEATFNRVFLKWLPTSQQTFDEKRPCFCEHFNLDYSYTQPEKLVTKIYIPLT